MRPAAARTPHPSFPPYAHQDAVSSLAASQNNFTRDMYVQLAQKCSGNLFFSPFSIMTALGMTYAGAGGNTEQEMTSVLHLTQNKDVIHDAFQDVVTDLKAEAAEYELRTSNMVYVSEKLPVMSQFANIMKEKYLSTSKTVDFGASEKVREEINQAVEKETNSRIKNLIPSGILNDLTRMVLVNAVYFKGLWDKQFQESSTHDQEFWTSNSESVTVPMMNMKNRFRFKFHKDLGATVLAMNYKGSRLSMVFVLPDKRDGLAEVEAKLANRSLSELDENLHEVEVNVTIPKFRLEESLSLVDHLKEMGIKDLFDDSLCDLSGMTEEQGLYVSHVLHKAFLEVNEQGSEAAAATAVVAMTRALVRPIPPFVADHPFLFYIRDQRSGLVQFVGRLLKP